MAEFVVSVFRLVDANGYYTPPCLDFHYLEQDTGTKWSISCGGTRVYLVRHGETLAGTPEEQAADSHFMVQRLTGSLLLAGAGLFAAHAAGRIFMRGVEGEVESIGQFDESHCVETEAAGVRVRTGDWFAAISTHTILRRAANDAHLALSHPHEAGVFVYRGLEWLVVGLGISWDDLAKDLGVAPGDLRDLKKVTNVGLGVRHATPSGEKLRASATNYGTWVCALFDAIVAVRAKLDPQFLRPTPEETAAAVLRALPRTPYA